MSFFLFSLILFLCANFTIGVEEVAKRFLQTKEGKVDKRPNFVVFFADDIGWGDFGANWSPNKNVTPNLNSLAEQGLRLTNFHAGASVCTPSRAALMTGRLGLRTGVIKNFYPPSKFGLPLNETTLSEVLHENGYKTGMIGKWHLGISQDYHPRSRGFDFYYGLPYSDDMGCVDVPCSDHPPNKPCPKKPNSTTAIDSNAPLTWKALPLFENYKIVEQPADLIQLGDHYGNKSTEFLKLASKSTEPFFLYVAFAHMHVPLAHAKRFSNSTSLNTVYSNTLHEMDDIVGRVISSLKTLNLFDNTLIWFTGDNGPWDQKCELSGSPGPYLASWQRNKYGGATSKTTTWEAGHREPTVVVWKNEIAPGKVSDALTSALDIFPTCLSLAGISLPKWRKYDGTDLSQFLKGKNESAHTVLFHPNSGDTPPAGEVDTVRMGPYKVYWKTGGYLPACDKSLAPIRNHDPPLLFNVDEDPAESKLLTPESFPKFNEVISQASKFRENFLFSVKSDNTTIADYSTSPFAVPCCDSTQFLCRCKRD